MAASSESDACVFCDIVAGRAEASVVHEDEHVVAFMDIEPVIVPRTAGDGFTIDARWRRRDRAELDVSAHRVRRASPRLAS
jgi:hypothetical protein